jgi:hypothetical protein
LLAAYRHKTRGNVKVNVQGVNATRACARTDENSNENIQLLDFLTAVQRRKTVPCRLSLTAGSISYEREVRYMRDPVLRVVIIIDIVGEIVGRTHAQ